MSISTSVTDDGNSVYITVNGRFDLHLHSEFRGSYRNEEPAAFYTIDLSATDYIDSSALGMLLLLRGFAGGDQANISITGCSESIKNIFTLTSFSRLFSVN